MFRNIRLLVTIGVLSGVSLGTIAGFATGFFQSVYAKGSGMVDAMIAWFNQPLTWEHLAGGLGILAIPLGILVAMLVISDL